MSTQWGFLDRIKGALFGQGKIRCEITTEEGENGIAKAPYVGSLATLDEDELFQDLKDELLVEHGLHLKTMKIVGITQR